jgi:hypothetical protein
MAKKPDPLASAGIARDRFGFYFGAHEFGKRIFVKSVNKRVQVL